MISLRAQLRLAALLLIQLGVTSLPRGACAVDFLLCEKCHEGALEEDMGRTYLHAPFSLRQCGPCHNPAEATAQVLKEGQARTDEGRRVYWLEESPAVATSHWFLIPAAKMRDSLVVEARTAAGTARRQEMAVPRLNGLAAMKDLGRAPTISGVRVVEIQRGVFLSATIAWETDGVADAVVRYGKTDLGQTSSPSIRFGRTHQVVLYDLEPGKTYRFSAVSSDLFGRQQASQTYSFSTAKALPAARPAALSEPQAGERAALGLRFYRLAESYVVEASVDRPSALAIGVKGAALKPLPADTVARTAAKAEDIHGALSPKLVSSILACGKCHPSQGTATHPVNVYPKPGMIIPPEYPRLPDGRISCVSCHDVHGSNYEFLLRKAGLKDLCVGCHRDMR